MKTITALILALATTVEFTACTSVKQDDHSYHSFYQHQAAPPRQVVETTTTNSTRVRRYAAQEDDVLPDSRSVSTASSEPDFLQAPETLSSRPQRLGR